MLEKFIHDTRSLRLSICYSSGRLSNNQKLHMVKRRCRQWLFCGVLILCFFAVEAQPGLVWPQGQAGKDYNVVDSKGKRQGP
jgi:hypothetical protein